MNIQEVRLELVKQAIDKCLSPKAIPEIVEPLAKYVVYGSEDSHKGMLDKLEEKYTSDLLKTLQETFGQDGFGGSMVSAVEIGTKGTLRIWVSESLITEAVQNFLMDPKNCPDFFRGREIVFFKRPPKSP